MDWFGKLDPRKMPAHLFWRAKSLDYESAVPADIAEQSYSVCPRFWYIDARIQCIDCDEDFLFSKEEQKFWYENLKFWIDSFPKRCKRCQKAEKKMRLEINYIQNNYGNPKKTGGNSTAHPRSNLSLRICSCMYP